MKESGAQPIEISAMTTDTFRALLLYIYTDSLPADGLMVSTSTEPILLSALFIVPCLVVSVQLAVKM
jgi:hypothetical protein